MTTTIANPYADLARLLTRLTGDEKHEPSARSRSLRANPPAPSTLDVLWTLYDRVLRVDPTIMDDPERDRFLLSKGHGPAAYYTVLAARGFFPTAWLDTMGTWGSPLGHHPDRLRIPGVEISSGSLGHGLPLGVGVALGLRAQGLLTPRVFVLVGDAELDEGSNHEAIAYAGATGLGTLTAIVIDNQSATHGWPGGIASRFTVNGWTASTVAGHPPDQTGAAVASAHDQIEAAIRAATPGRPHVVVATTDPK